MNENDQFWLPGVSRRKQRRRTRLWVMLAAPVMAILFQTYAPLLAGVFSYLELPLLMVIYFSAGRRSPIGGLLAGAAVGLAQDALSHRPIGLLGMVKTIAGYAASSLGLRLDTDNPLVRFFLAGFFFAGHQLLFWILRRALLNDPASPALAATFLAAVVNGALAVPLFHALDKLRENP